MTTLVSQTHWYTCRLSCSYLKLVGPSYANVATLFNQTHWHTCRLSCCRHQTESSEYNGTQSHRHRYHRTPQHIEGMPFRHKTRVLCRDNVSTQALTRTSCPDAFFFFCTFRELCSRICGFSLVLFWTCLHFLLFFFVFLLLFVTALVHSLQFEFFI